MKTLQKTGLLLLLVIASSTVKAQQDAMFTHYMYNTLAVNPGYAGSRDALTVTALHRSQWVGFDGAPTTQTLTLHSPMLNNKMGIGLSVLNDKIGPTNTTAFYLDLAYAIKVSEKAKLAFGLKGGINVMKADLNSKVNPTLDQQNDPSFESNYKSKILPNFGFGIYYYLPKFYVGVSTPKLLENNFKGNTTTGTTNLISEKRHYFLIAGAVFKINDNVDLKPTTFVKVTNAAPIEADLTASFIFNKKFLLGGMFRTGDALGVLIGYNFTDQFHAGYSFDWSYGNKTFKYNQGSHEIMLSYDFIYKDKQKIRSPRYF
jgi:type IX secretion system PorP/SprF family membrane protein